jgi:hypothetical protein
MESPLNKKIQRSLEREAAKKKKDSNYIPVLTLRQQVLSLVTEANKSAQPERQVTPRSALIVMDRALASLAVVDEESRDFAVLREVSSFISTAQKTSVMTASAHVDLLPQGHPLSALNASLTPEEYRFKYAQWLAADADVSSAARPLVAAAFSAKPGSIERDHAFMRLSVTKENVPGYFKLDPAPIIAAFSDGNSSAARRARVALQWRDKKGRWVEMGRGANFRYRTSSGGVASASGVYVGVRPKQPGENYTAGLIQVSGDKNLPDGIYAVRPSNAETYSARVPLEALKKAGIKPGATPSQSMVGVPTQDEVLATRRDAPEGWTKSSDNTFNSDDNYTVKGGDGEYTLYRQNEDGSLGDKVGEAGNWAEINELASNDQDAYDEVKGQASSPEAREQVKARIATRTKHNEEFDRLEELVKSGVDQNGNKVPAGWEGIVRPGRAADIERRAIGADRVLGEEGLPRVEYRKAIAYDYDTEPVYAEASYDLTGKFAAYDKRYDSWEEAEADIPRWIAAEEKKRDRKLTPVEPEEIKLPKFEDGPSDYARFGPEPDDADYRAGFFDKDGNRLSSPSNLMKSPLDVVPGDEVKLPNGNWVKVKRVSKDEKRLEGRKKTIPLVKVEYEDENGKTAVWKWTPFAEDGQGNKVKSLETRASIEELLSPLTEEQNKKIDAEIRDLIKNPPAPTEMDKRVEKLLKEQRAEWDKAKEDNYARIFDRGDQPLRIGGQDDYLGPVKTKQLNDEFRKELEEKNRKSDAQAKDIYDRRMAGESLDKVAKDLGLTREEVRYIEAKYARQNPDAVEKVKNTQDVDKALDFLDKHMDDEGTTEARAIGISEAQDYLKEAKKYLEAGDTKSAMQSLGFAYDIIDGLESPSEGIFPNGKNSAEAADIVDKLTTRLEESQSPTPPSGNESSISKEAFNDLKNKIAEENKGGYAKSGLYFFHDLIGSDDGALSKDIAFMIDGDEEFSPLGTISPDGTITWNDPSKEEDWAPALKNALKSLGGDGGGSDEPPSGGGSDTPGSGFSDYVIDLASGNTDPDKDLQERLDEDVEELAVDFIENIYEDAGDVYDLAQDIKDNKPEGMSDKEFIDDAAAQMRENLEAIVDRAIEDRNDFVEDGDAEPVDFDKETFINIAIERYKELVQEELDGIREDEGDDDGDGPDEPPTPPSGGTPPKTPSPSTPSAPSLYKEFDVPNGAFELRGVDYEPEGRVDEKSSDFTDDPEKLATKFSVQDLIAAFSEAILGNSSDASVAEILNANVGDDDEMDAPSEVDVDVNMPQVTLGSPSGAGRLEFNAGEEFVLAESLFNALWHAGVDPNRVLANLYDSVNGDNKNLSKLIEAQGGTPSPEEAQLVDDITAEIRQIKDTTPGDEPSIANQKDEPFEELQGSLIENVAIDFENPDYYIPDSSAYVPSQEEPDENGYTDNPEILATDYEEADLIMQMLEGITDGSGAALLNFGDVTTEVPVEAIRDALQLQGINTNDILVDLKRESNDMSEPDSETPRLQAHSQMIQDLVEQTGNTVDDDTADKIRDAIDEKGLVDWSEADDAEIIEAIAEVAGPGILGREVQEDVTPTPSPVSPPQSGDRQPYKPEEVTIEGEQSQPADVPVDSPEFEAQQYNYPGPREAGYTANNVVLDSNGAAVGAGARVQALVDGRAGTVLAVQNIDTRTGRDADYVRIRFDDGTTAVRSARQIFGIDAGAPLAQGEGPGQLPPARRNPIAQDPAQRFNEPAPAGTPVIAGDGSIPGVNLVDVPDDIAAVANPDAKQADFAVWGLRAPEIARAGRERVSLDKVADLVEKYQEANEIAFSRSVSAEERASAKQEADALAAQIKRFVSDAYGVRPGVKFGKNNYTIKDNPAVYFSKEDDGKVTVTIGFRIFNEQGQDIGEGSRRLVRKNVTNPDGTVSKVWTVKNEILKIPNTGDKKSGFITAYNRYMEDWYIANGVSSVKVYAAGNGREWQGGYVWAINGFNWDGTQAGAVPRILRSMLGQRGITDEEVAIIQRMQARVAKDNPTGDYKVDTVPTPLEIALIGWYPGAKNWIGKKQMISMSWNGEKRLDPQAMEQRQAINYDQSRNARKRVEDKLNQAGVSRDLVLKMSSNEFAAANPELAPYLDQIRDVLRNNRSLAVLSPAAKTALNRFTASQLLKGEDRTVALQDIFKLRTALDAEFKADNPLAGSKDFGVGSQLLDVSIDDVRRNNVPGFTVRQLGMYESGVNETFMLTHNDSGQIFFVKKDSYAAQYQIDGAGAEVQADAMIRASGVVGSYETRVSNVDPEIIVMQRAGAGVPLLGEPMTASNAIGNKLSINLPDGTTVKVNASNFMDLLHTPEEAVRVMLVDLIISNMDRHNGNLLLAVDGTDAGKVRILPIDHALSSFSPDTEGMQFTVQELFDNSNDNLYGMAMPVLTKRLKQEEILDLFKNEARIMMEELNNPANLPTGKELDLIVKNFGSLDGYRQKIQERIDSLLTPGNEGYQTFLSVLKPSYWSTR